MFEVGANGSVSFQSPGGAQMSLQGEKVRGSLSPYQATRTDTIQLQCKKIIFMRSDNVWSEMCQCDNIRFVSSGVSVLFLCCTSIATTMFIYL